MVPSGSPDRCAAPPPEKLTAVATAFLPASFSLPRCYTAHTPPDRPAGYPAGQYRAPRDALQNNLPRSPCHFQYIPASPGYIYPPSAAAQAAAGPAQRLQAIAQRGEIYPRPIALNDTPLLQALHPLGGARRGQPHSRAQDLERNSGILSQAGEDRPVNFIKYVIHIFHLIIKGISPFYLNSAISPCQGFSHNN